MRSSHPVSWCCRSQEPYASGGTLVGWQGCSFFTRIGNERMAFTGGCDHAVQILLRMNDSIGYIAPSTMICDRLRFVYDGNDALLWCCCSENCGERELEEMKFHVSRQISRLGECQTPSCCEL